MIVYPCLCTGADSTYGIDSSLGIDSSPGIDSTLESIPCDSDSGSFSMIPVMIPVPEKNGIITSLSQSQSFSTGQLLPRYEKLLSGNPAMISLINTPPVLRSESELRGPNGFWKARLRIGGSAPRQNVTAVLRTCFCSSFEIQKAPLEMEAGDGDG